jgi:hypothetical protein
MNTKKILLLIILSLSICTQAQISTDPFALEEDDLNIGGDIFNDFNEDIESAQMTEDERFYRYGRFFSFQLGIGLTTFDGNRGVAYDNDPPTYNIGVNYFLDFQNSFGMGLEYSKHNMFVDQPTVGFPDFTTGAGFIDIAMLRVYFSARYYIDTADLGTAITYSNPYLTARLEYWYRTAKFRDQEGIIPNDSGGGFGIGIGGGLEFPIKIKESYLGVEALWHSVAYDDKFTQNFRADPAGNTTLNIDDLTGNAYSIMTSYVMNW